MEKKRPQPPSAPTDILPNVPCQRIALFGMCFPLSPRPSSFSIYCWNGNRNSSERGAHRSCRCIEPLDSGFGFAFCLLILDLDLLVYTDSGFGFVCLYWFWIWIWSFSTVYSLYYTISLYCTFPILYLPYTIVSPNCTFLTLFEFSGPYGTFL